MIAGDANYDINGEAQAITINGEAQAITINGEAHAITINGEAQAITMPRRILAALRSKAPPRPPLAQIAGSGISAAACIAALAVPHCFELLEHKDIVMLVGTFGASACIVCATHSLAVAQPRNVIGGHVISAAVGLGMFELELATDSLVGMWYTTPLSAGIATAAMLATRTFHPPAAGTALLALVGSPAVHAMGWWFLVTPALTGSIILCGVGVFTNRIWLRRDYPTYWW